MTERAKNNLSSHVVVEEDFLWRTFLDLCAFGGRFCGTDGERRAAHYLEDRLSATGLSETERWEFDYVGWRCNECRLELPDRPGWTARVLPLVYSSATSKDGLVVETIDYGISARNLDPVISEVIGGLNEMWKTHDMRVPVDRVMPFEQANECHEVLLNGKFFGKLVLTF